VISRAQRLIPIAQPLLGREEQEAVAQVLASGQLAQGELVATFERRFAALCSVREAVAVSSGTAALHLALLAHQIGPGDEVITTPFSFAATANTIRLVGATAVFVDIEPDTYNLDPALVAAAITPRTKAILPVHLYGNPCDMEHLLSLAQAHHLVVIEDACQAHAATIDDRPVGSFGTGCFSFYPTKNMTTGEGGMVTTNDTAIAERVRLWRSHGQKERYHHVALGYNLRLTEIQAAIGLAQLDKLPRFTALRIAHAAYLTEALHAYVPTPVARPGHRHVYHQYTIRVPAARGDRDAWAQTLRANEVGTAVHYPCPIHQQPFYREQGITVALPVAEMAAREVLSLPVHPGLSHDDLATIAREVTALCV
jgi:dTDP-4-amino-4,6-dideoxygalactose transaminase